MITLRELVKRDRSIAAITSEECRLISFILDFFNNLNHHWLLKYFIPKELRSKKLEIRMLAAILGRSPSDVISLNTQIQREMKAAKDG